MKSKVDIRAAKEDDVATIYDFIMQLAVFEKAPEKVLATPETLTRTLGLNGPSDTEITATTLKPGQFAKCMIADVDRKPAGFIVFFYNYSTV